jgi:hypothetical protein
MTNEHPRISKEFLSFSIQERMVVSNTLNLITKSESDGQAS